MRNDVLRLNPLFAHVLIGLASTGVMTVAHAQSTEDLAPAEEAGQQARATATDLDGIVVSAQKKEESILEVPLSVSMVTGDDLMRENLVTLESFATRIPSVSVSGGNIADISIRGINTGNATSPTVAITIDDVPFGSSSWAGNSTIPNLDPAEIERIEVLRGPQGTLYGASSLGGLIKYVTRAPDTHAFSGRVEAGFSQVDGGSGGGLLRGSFNIPLIADRLGLRLSAYKRQDPEYADRYGRATGQLEERNVNSSDVDGFRAAAQFRATDNFTIDLSHMEQDTSSRNSASTEMVVGTYEPLYGYFGSTSSDSRSDQHMGLTQLNMELDLGSFTVKSVSGWSRSEVDRNSDSTNAFGFVFDGIPAIGIPPVYPDAPDDAQVRLIDASSSKRFSQELRFSSNNDGRVQWMFGAFYTDEESLLDQDMFAAQANGERIGPVVAFPLPSTYEEKALFADATFQITDRFDLKAGARYSENEQTYQANQTVAPSAEVLFGPSAVGDVAHSSDESFTWQFSPRFQLTEDVMVYGRIASGYRPGGPNSAIAPQPTFDPDTVVNAELGLKGVFLDRRLVLDTSLFNIDWKDIQLGATTQASVSYFTNGGSACSRGLEVATTLVPAYNWKLTANATFADATLRDPLPTQGAGSYLLGAVGDQLPYTAKFSGNLGVEKSWDLRDTMLLTVGGNYSHVGDRDTDFRSSAATGDRRDKLIAPSYDLIDAFLRLEDSAWAATLYMRNLTDERGIRTIGDSGGMSSSMTASFLQPRTIGVSFAYNF